MFVIKNNLEGSYGTKDGCIANGIVDLACHAESGFNIQ